MTFDGATLTTTDGSSVIQVTTDHSLTEVDDHQVSWDGLLLARITQPDALQGTYGADCMKIHGDTFERLHGNLQMDVNKRLAPDAPAGGVVINIDGDTSTTYHGNVAMTFQPIGADPGVYTETYHNQVQRTYLDDTTENHHAQYTLNQPDDATIEHKRYDNEAIGEQLSITDVQLELCNLVHLEVGLAHAEAKAAHAEAKLIHYEAKLLHKSDVWIETDTHLEDEQITFLRDQLVITKDDKMVLEHHTGFEYHSGAAIFEQINGVGIVVPG